MTEEIGRNRHADEKVFEVNDAYPYCNLSIRDVFAVFAMHASMLAPGDVGAEALSNDYKNAKWAYATADAMMEQRRKK